MVHLELAELKEPEEITLLERLIHMKELVPMIWRNRLTTVSEYLGWGAKGLFSWTVKGTWILATGLLVLYAPILRGFDHETVVIENLQAEMQQNAMGGGAPPGAQGGMDMGPNFGLSIEDLGLTPSSVPTNQK